MFADFLDDVECRLADRLHQKRGEDERQQRAYEEADGDCGVEQVDGLQAGFLGERGEKRERAEGGAGDCEALGGGLRGVADRVELVRYFADRGGQAGHFRDSAGVVGDGAVGVEGDDYSRQGKHGGRGDGNAVEPGEPVGHSYGDHDGEHGKRRGFHSDREALYEHRACAGLCGLGYFPYGPVFLGGVVFGD